MPTNRIETQQVLDNLPQLVCVTDADGVINFLNRGWHQYTGLVHSGDLEALWFSSVHPEDHTVVVDAWKAGIPSRKVFEHRYRIRSGEGKYRWFLSHAGPLFNPLGNITGWICTSIDIQAQMNAEALARTERDRLNTIVENLPVGIVLGEAPSGKIVFLNPALEEIFGHPIDHAQGATPDLLWTAYHPNGVPLEPEEYPLRRAIAKGEIVPPEEYLSRHADGTFSWVRVAATPITNNQGEIVAGIAAVTDIDAEKRLQERNVAAQARFLQLIESSIIGLAIGNVRGELTYLNPSLFNLLGYSDQEVRAGKLRWDEITPPEFASLDAKAVSQLERSGTCDPYEKVFLSKEGRRIPVLIGASSIRNEAGTDTEVAVFVMDLTNAKRTESALLQAEKLAVAGRLAASISHEINNPLEAVTNLLYLIGMNTSLPRDVAEYLRQAQAELARVSHIASQTLRFYRQTSKPSPMRSEDLVDSVITLYRSRLISAGVELVLEHQEHPPMLSYANELRQVLANLIGNALDALNGTIPRILTIRTRPAISPTTGKRGIRITIADTGTGISPETLKRIFEPFYTTKAETGTGLGLWVCEEIVHKREGTLRAHSSQSPSHRGTVFAIFLPYYTQEEPPQIPSPS